MSTLIHLSIFKRFRSSLAWVLIDSFTMVPGGRKAMIYGHFNFNWTHHMLHLFQNFPLGWLVCRADFQTGTECSKMGSATGLWVCRLTTFFDLHLAVAYIDLWQSLKRICLRYCRCAIGWFGSSIPNMYYSKYQVKLLCFFQRFYDYRRWHHKNQDSWRHGAVVGFILDASAARL